MSTAVTHNHAQSAILDPSLPGGPSGFWSFARGAFGAMAGKLPRGSWRKMQPKISDEHVAGSVSWWRLASVASVYTTF